MSICNNSCGDVLEGCMLIRTCRASTAGDKRAEVNGFEGGHTLEERKKRKQGGDGALLFSQLIDDTEDDFSKMCRDAALGMHNMQRVL